MPRISNRPDVVMYRAAKRLIESLSPECAEMPRAKSLVAAVARQIANHQPIVYHFEADDAT